jgi:hypothetical protein
MAEFYRRLIPRFEGCVEKNGKVSEEKLAALVTEIKGLEKTSKVCAIFHAELWQQYWTKPGRQLPLDYIQDSLTDKEATHDFYIHPEAFSAQPRTSSSLSFGIRQGIMEDRLFCEEGTANERGKEAVKRLTHSMAFNWHPAGKPQNIWDANAHEFQVPKDYEFCYTRGREEFLGRMRQFVERECEVRQQRRPTETDISTRFREALRRLAAREGSDEIFTRCKNLMNDFLDHMFETLFKCYYDWISAVIGETKTFVIDYSRSTKKAMDNGRSLSEIKKAAKDDKDTALPKGWKDATRTLHVSAGNDNRNEESKTWLKERSHDMYITKVRGKLENSLVFETILGCSEVFMKYPDPNLPLPLSDSF